MFSTTVGPKPWSGRAANIIPSFRRRCRSRRCPAGGFCWGRPYLNREFFSRLGAGMADQVLLVMAKRSGVYIAGALNLFGEGVLYGRNWGALEYLPFLHFETCYYQAIEFAIARGFRKVEA